MSSPDLPNELHPQLLYRRSNEQAQFATWRLNTGHESLALFSTSDIAEKYRAALPESADWSLFEPSRDKLIDILQACRATGILYAALDPHDGAAKTLFDIPQVLSAAAEV
jgi:hypothetical protein